MWVQVNFASDKLWKAVLSGFLKLWTAALSGTSLNLSTTTSVSICVSSIPEVQHHCILAYVLQVWSSNTYTSSSVRFTVYVWVCFLSLCICTTWMPAVCEVRRQPQILGFESYGRLWATTYLFIVYLEVLGTHSCVRAMSALNHWASHLFNLLYVTFIELFKSLIGIYKEIIPLCVDYLTH